MFWDYSQALQEHKLLKADAEKLQACLENKRKLKERYDSLQARSAKLNRVVYRPKNPAKLLSVIHETINGNSLQDMTVKKKKLDLALTAEDSTAALKYAHRLRSQELFSQVDIGAIEQSESGTKLLLHAEIK